MAIELEESLDYLETRFSRLQVGYIIDHLKHN